MGLSRNPKLLCAYHALQMSLFPMAIITLFWKRHIGMSMAEIMVLQGVFGLAMAAFEFPSGYLADRIGYRRTLLLAAGLSAAGWSLYIRSETLGAIVVAEIVLGIANSLISGCDSALLYESLVETKREREFATWNGRVRFFGQVGEGSAAIVAGPLFALWAQAPFVLEVVIWLVNGVVAWHLVEPARHRPPAKDNLRQIRALVRHVLFEKPALRAVVMTTMALGMASFVPVWTIQLYASDAGVAEIWLGLIWSAANYNVAVWSLFSRRVGDRLGLPLLLGLCVTLIATGYLGLGLVHAWWGFAFYFALTAMRGLFGPVLLHEEQRLIPSSDRAGFLSFRSLMFRSSFLVLGPAVGVAIDRFGQHDVMLGLGLLFVTTTAAGSIAVIRSIPPSARSTSQRKNLK